MSLSKKKKKQMYDLLHEGYSSGAVGKELHIPRSTVQYHSEKIKKQNGAEQKLSVPVRRTPDLSSVDASTDTLPYHVRNELFLMQEEQQQDKDKIAELDLQIKQLTSERDKAISERDNAIRKQRDEIKQTLDLITLENDLLRSDNKWRKEQYDGLIQFIIKLGPVVDRIDANSSKKEDDLKNLEEKLTNAITNYGKRRSPQYLLVKDRWDTV